jgi:hypothetical protein
MSVWGGAGTDTITGGPKNDYLHGGANYDRIWGSGGNDQIWGDDGGDSLDGGVGNDIIDGNAGNDLILGRDGDDDLYDGAGNDRLYGGAGELDILYSSYEGTGTDKDLLSGGAGEDGVTYELRGTAVTADADGKTGDDGRKGEGDSISTDVEDIGGGWGNDRLMGTSRSDLLFGFFGDDTLTAAGGDDWVLGSYGVDNLDGGSNFAVGGDTCDGEPGENVVNCELQEGEPLPTPEAGKSATAEQSRNVLRKMLTRGK